MAKKLYEEANITNIANAIRSKTGKTNHMLVSEMAAAINSIELFDIAGLVDGTTTKKIIIPKNVKSIRDYCFYGCRDVLIEFEQSSALTQIGEGAFHTCTAVNLTKLPDSVNIIENKAFCYCLGLALTALPANLITIGDSAFYSCTGLEIVDIPQSVTAIGDAAFGNCTYLTSITFEGTPETIASNAFDGCTSLTTINVPWAEGAVPNAPWGATAASINYNTQ